MKKVQTSENNQVQSNEVKYRAEIFDNKRIRISMHNDDPYKDKQRFIMPLQRIKRDGYMTRKEYTKQLKRHYRELFKRQYNSNNCFFITLTFAENCDIDDVLNYFHSYRIGVERNLGKFKYIRALEFHSQGTRLHIHSIFQFPECVQVDTSQLCQLWNHGRIQVKPIYNLYGALEYITLFKDTNIQAQKDRDGKYLALDGYKQYLTYFPSGTKIITSSQNFGKEIDPQIVYLTENQIDELCKSQTDFVRKDSHYYRKYDKNGKYIGRELYLDTLYIKDANEFIEKNLTD